MKNEDLSGISQRFLAFAMDCEGSSELYHSLALKVAEDEDLLRIAQMSRAGQPEPNMLFGVVHWLLLQGKSHALGRYYPSIDVNFEKPKDAYPSFRMFALENSSEILPLLQKHLVQTNEVQRCAYLLPAILSAGQYFEGRGISVIELGASAGFNLLWDHYRYQYDDEEPIGLLESSLAISSAWKGDNRPNLTGSFPEIKSRIGIDLSPIEVKDFGQMSWLHALIWPEHFDRRVRLSKAVKIALDNPVHMVEGDAISVLPDILDEVHPSIVPFVYHTWVANQMSQKQRDQLLQIIDDFGQKRDIVHIHTNIEPHLHATIYRNGERIDLPLANVDGHARWIEWLT